MSKLDKQRRMVVESLKQFDRNSQEIHAMADKLHRRMQELHLETIAIRERARAARKSAEAKSQDAVKVIRAKPRKAA